MQLFNIVQSIIPDSTCDPPLKARNPNIKIKPPNDVKGSEWRCISRHAVPTPNRPVLGPIM